MDILSYDDLGAWEDLDAISVVGEEVVCDPRTIDPRPTPPDIADIDKSIQGLEAELTRLKLRRSHLLAERALVGRLPSELLSRIFELGVHEHVKMLHAISLVSRHWNNVALATPSLWTYIILDPEWGIDRLPAFMRKLRVCLERSQACKLLVDIDIGYMDAEDVQDIMVVLKPHLVRCFDFRLSAQSWDTMSPIRVHITTLGPALERLSLRIHASEIHDETPYCSLLVEPCPLLRSITLEHLPLVCVGVDVPKLRTLCLMRDRQVRRTTYRRFGIAFRELLSLMSTTVALQNLRLQSVALQLDGNEDIFQSTPPVTVVSSLRSLSFHHVDAANVSLFFESTALPALERLTVCMEPNAEENMHWLSRLSVFAPARLPALCRLELRACNIEGAALVPFVRALHQLPQLRALSLSSPRMGFVGTQIFELLGTPPTPPSVWLLPRLEALSVHQCMDVSGHEMLRLVRARIDSPSLEAEHIRYLKISQCESFDPDAHELLKSLVPVVRIS